MSDFKNILDVAIHLRSELDDKKYLAIFAYNGTGKTRLSVAFKDLGKTEEASDTLYFNAFTEDLFSWDNDLDGDSQRILKLNSKSRFFAGLDELEMENRIRPFLHRYTDFDFSIDYDKWTISFSREIQTSGSDGTEPTTEVFENIKISRGEESLFIWCFFLAIAQLALDGAEAYKWVKYIYIDDPISSLDENNTIALAHHLAQLLKRKDHDIKTVISSHHALFFNVMWNELRDERKKFYPYFLSYSAKNHNYALRYTGDTPFFHHVATLIELNQAAETGELYTHHFNTLRTILEKSACFHGFNKFSALIQKDEDDPDGVLYTRLINVLNHGNYSLYEPREMLEENKDQFKKILGSFLNNYNFNPELFPKVQEES